jgi:AcrR family transcriptional regulator
MREDTNNKIINSAIELFAKHSYNNVSILQICKNANISNGVIYNFYKNKKELLKFLLNETANRLNLQFKKISGSNITLRMESFISLNIDITQKEFSLIKIYREGQYKFPEYEQKFRSVYLDALKRIYNRELKELEYIFIISGIRFINVNYTKRGIVLDIPFLAQILLSGFLTETDFKIEDFDESDFYIRTLFNTENTKHKLLNVGERLFGEKGFYKIKIEDITKEAGVKVGSFYYYFTCKEEFLRIIIKNIKIETINFLQDNRNKNYNNNKTQLLFLYLLLEYYKKAQYKYELIRASEFVTSDLDSIYHEALETLYVDNLNELSCTEGQKQIISSLLIGIAHYMGIEFLFTKNLRNKKDFLSSMKFFFSNGLSK